MIHRANGPASKCKMVPPLAEGGLAKGLFQQPAQRAPTQGGVVWGKGLLAPLPLLAYIFANPKTVAAASERVGMVGAHRTVILGGITMRRQMPPNASVTPTI